MVKNTVMTGNSQKLCKSSHNSIFTELFTEFLQQNTDSV